MVGWRRFIAIIIAIGSSRLLLLLLLLLLASCEIVVCSEVSDCVIASLVLLVRITAPPVTWSRVASSIVFMTVSLGLMEGTVCSVRAGRDARGIAEFRRSGRKPDAADRVLGPTISCRGRPAISTPPG